MEKVSEASLQNDRPVFYFPHHPELKPDSSTTKLRTVFNGSATTSSGISLNDNLMAGPCLQNELLHILLRFRCPTFVLTADIKKMFRQIEIHEDDRQLQLILWRFSPEDAVSTYCLKTVTYGTRSAPFAAARCLKQHALDYAHIYLEAAEVLETDFYMDDALTGHDEQERLMLIKQQLINILSSAGFELHKWTSNIAEAQDEEQETDNTKILGLRWNSRTDMFSFSNELDNVITATKRNVLSEVQKVFDPLGNRVNKL